MWVPKSINKMFCEKGFSKTCVCAKAARRQEKADNRGNQMVYFQTKNPHSGIFCRALQVAMENVGKVYGHLE
jgi:hypothetical protein